MEVAEQLWHCDGFFYVFLYFNSRKELQLFQVLVAIEFREKAILSTWYFLPCYVATVVTVGVINTDNYTKTRYLFIDWLIYLGYSHARINEKI